MVAGMQSTVTALEVSRDRAARRKRRVLYGTPRHPYDAMRVVVHELRALAPREGVGAGEADALVEYGLDVSDTVQSQLFSVGVTMAVLVTAVAVCAIGWGWAALG